MSYPAPRRLQLPVEPYSAAGYVFEQRVRRRGVWWACPPVWWAVHLGDDLLAQARTPVRAIGEGAVVFARTLPGSEAKRNWGGLVILGHQNDNYQLSIINFQTFYSLYGHLAGLKVAEGETVSAGQEVGVVAEGLTAENGWWRTPHLHFAIYTGPLPARRNGGAQAALPGYWRPERWWRTRRSWWHDPREFIASYNRASKLVNM